MGSASSSEPAPPAREQSYCGPGRSRGRRSQFHPAQEPGLPYLPTNAGGARPWRATAREILLGSPDRLPHRESRTRRHNSQVILLQFLSQCFFEEYEGLPCGVFCLMLTCIVSQRPPAKRTILLIKAWLMHQKPSSLDRLRRTGEIFGGPPESGWLGCSTSAAKLAHSK